MEEFLENSQLNFTFKFNFKIVWSHRTVKTECNKKIVKQMAFS